MLRTVLFSNNETEVHGFKEIYSLKENEYDNTIVVGGMTALYDATYNSIESLGNYSKDLYKNDFNSNGLIFILTDGEDNNSSKTADDVKNLLASVRKAEIMTSLDVIIVGMLEDVSSLRDFADNINVKFIKFGDVNKNSLSKLASFISKSIAIVSKKLGTNDTSSFDPNSIDF